LAANSRSGPPCGVPQDRQRAGVVRSGRERSQVRDEQRDIFERRLLVFLEVEAEPAGGEAAVAVRLLPRDQRSQLERLGDRYPADLSCGYLGEDEVVVFQRPAEDRSRMALRGRRCSSPGAERRNEFKAVRTAGGKNAHARTVWLEGGGGA
jgi:hypothetical protein